MAASSSGCSLRDDDDDDDDDDLTSDTKKKTGWMDAWMNGHDELNVLLKVKINSDELILLEEK